MSDTPETDALVENIGMGCEMVDAWFARKLERERDKWKAKFIQANKDYGFELRDPCGTIWDHAKKLQQKCEEARDEAVRLREDYLLELQEALRATRERDEARKQLRVAVGLLSTTPKFQDQHPEDVLKFVEEAAK